MIWLTIWFFFESKKKQKKVWDKYLNVLYMFYIIRNKKLITTQIIRINNNFLITLVNICISSITVLLYFLWLKKIYLVCFTYWKGNLFHYFNYNFSKINKKSKIDDVNQIEKNRINVE